MYNVVHFQSFGAIEAYERLLLLQDFSLMSDSTECTIFFYQLVQYINRAT